MTMNFWLDVALLIFVNLDISHLERRASCRDRVIAVELILSLKTSLLLNLKHLFLCPNTTSQFLNIETGQDSKEVVRLPWQGAPNWGKWPSSTSDWRCRTSEECGGKATRCSGSTQLRHLLLIEQRRRKTETQQLAILLAFSLSLIYLMVLNVRQFDQAPTALLLVQLMSREHLREHSPRFQITDTDLRTSHTIHLSSTLTSNCRFWASISGSVLAVYPPLILAVLLG